LEFEVAVCAPHDVSPDADVRAELLVDGRAQDAFVPLGEDGREKVMHLGDYWLGRGELHAVGAPYPTLKPRRQVMLHGWLPLAPLRARLADGAVHPVELRVREAGRPLATATSSIQVGAKP